MTKFELLGSYLYFTLESLIEQNFMLQIQQNHWQNQIHSYGAQIP